MAFRRTMTTEMALEHVREVLFLGASEFTDEHDSAMTALSQREVRMERDKFMLVDHEHEFTAVLRVEIILHNRPTDLERALDDPSLPVGDEG